MFFHFLVNTSHYTSIYTDITTFHSSFLQDLNPSNQGFITNNRTQTPFTVSKHYFLWRILLYIHHIIIRKYMWNHRENRAQNRERISTINRIQNRNLKYSSPSPINSASLSISLELTEQHNLTRIQRDSSVASQRTAVTLLEVLCHSPSKLYYYKTW